MKGRYLLVFLALALVLAVPFLLRPRQSLLEHTQDHLVIISPHNEAIRYEFSRAFMEDYKRRTGRTVSIDWRTPGGTSEIARYLKGEYYSAFQNEWQKSGRHWSPGIAAAFDNPRITLPPSSGEDSPAQSARRAFLQSSAGIGIDIFFGGGSFDFIQQADAGRLVDCEARQRHPAWFADDSIPAMVSGERFYDPAGRWIGAALSSFGICYNVDSLRRLGVREIPAAWSDLASPLFFRQVALADPTKSGSASKAFEMLIQQQIQLAGGDSAVPAGWVRGLNLTQAASANARYFTDAAGRVPVDVAAGDAAIGMCIDFYGRFESEAVRLAGNPSRLEYFTPAGGSAVSVDPIGLLRGAPHPAVARDFIDFVLSLEGQKLWNFRVGTPGGPVKYALRRLPIRRELYASEYAAFRSDPTVFPYEEAKLFTYHPAWTAALFKSIAFIIRVMSLDCHDEQAAAWQALIDHRFPPEATALFYDVSTVSWQVAQEKIRPVLSSADRIAEVRLARELTDHFRAQYRAAEQLAREGK